MKKENPLKKEKILLYFLFISFNLFSQNTFVPDDNFEQFLIDAGYDSGPLDDFVPTANINSIVEIDLTGNEDYIRDIESLEGIEDFTALENLFTFCIKTTNLDLSSNLNLKKLDLIGCGNSIEEINLTNNINLEYFSLITTIVSEIDLSKNIELKEVIIGTNIIINLDLSFNTKLEHVNITHSNMENVNLKNGNNTNITTIFLEGLFNAQCIKVDDEDYSLTNWTNVDDNSVFSETCGPFVDLTYVPDDNFEQELINLGYDSGALDDYVPTANINTITELIIINKNIADLTGIQDFIALEELQFQGNNVSEVNLSTLINLKNLWSGNNNLTNIDVTNNTNLINLFTGGNNFNEIDVSNNLLLEQLEISITNISNIDLSNNVNLSYFSCGETNISVLNLENNLELTYFYCWGNNLSNLDLSSHTKLFELICSNNPLTSLMLPPNNIIDGLHVNNTLISELDLRNQANLITHPASFLEIQNNPNLECVFVDDVNQYNTDVWDAITKDTHTTFVLDEAACIALNCNVNVDELNDINECDNFTLPTLTNGKYYTESNGSGTQLNAGDIITSTQTIFIYNEDNTNSACFNESSFEVLITSTPNVDTLNNVSECDSFTLPSLTNGKYYTETNGSGTQLNVGDIITSSQTIFIYNEDSANSTCFNESSFNIDISVTPDVDDLVDVVVNESYTLPTLTNGNYYTETNGNGSLLNAGELVTESQIIYIYNVNSTNTSCFKESSFKVTITLEDTYNIPLFFTPNNDTINDTWIVTSSKEIEEILIFDRFGKLLSKPELQLGWDGTYKGKKVTSNTYWYKIFFKDNSLKSGSLTLLRK